jgi:hypothetical protein
MMHDEFGEWYRSAGMEPDGEILPKRWAAIEQYPASVDDAVSLARLFYSLGRPVDSFLAGFRKSFYDVDPAFKMRGNDQEMTVLAGAELIYIIQGLSSTDKADLAALLLVCAGAQNLRVPAVRRIPEIAAKYLSSRAIARGGVTEEEGAGEERTALGHLQRQLSIVSEETNMLWWLFSEYSRDAEQPWTAFSVPAIALMAGKELADLTTVLPGPIAARAFLDRVLRCARNHPPASISIEDSINNVSIPWRQRYSDTNCSTELEDLSPISRGIKLSLTAPENNGWLAAFVQTTGVSRDAEMAPHILAYQVFLESLLCRSWKGLRGKA